MKVLITGVNGFVGPKVVLALLAAGHSVCGIDRMPAPFLSRYNFQKLFKSIEYSAAKAWAAVGMPQWDIENTLYAEDNKTTGSVLGS